MINHKIRNYEDRLLKVMSNLTEIAGMEPQELYLCRLMDTVIFHDFETALSVVIEDFHSANDNKKHEE